MGIKEQVSTFTTRFPGGLSSPRSQNIVQAAKDVDGTIVLPGETFSLNGHTGERGYAQGYQDAPVILDGKLVPGVGGGISQFTTTLFNATYYAGMEDVEHKPHSYWFDRYPAVIESTIFWPDLDFKFRNNTDTGSLSTRRTRPARSPCRSGARRSTTASRPSTAPAGTSPGRRPSTWSPGPSCIASNGIDGFTQDAFRVISKDGKVIKREKFTWTYLARPYVCGPEPS